MREGQRTREGEANYGDEHLRNHAVTIEMKQKKVHSCVAERRE